MKVSGFTIVRNAIKYDYPVVESILSVLPVVDEMVVAVGDSEDETLQLIESIASPKIKIVHSVWDDQLRTGGRLLAVETNKAFQSTSPDSDWCFYIQADEVLHEKYHDTVKSAMLHYKDDKEVEGLLFNYLHFYGSYSYVADSPKWYNHEIRIIRKSNLITSWGDAQGFRKYKTDSFIDMNDWARGASKQQISGIVDKSVRAYKLRVKAIDASIYHYGWVKDPKAQQRKQENFHKMWHGDEWIKKNVVAASDYDYSIIDSLSEFIGTHPAVMQKRINESNWAFEFDVSKKQMPVKYQIRKWLKNKLGISVGEYRNYKLL